MKLLQVGSEICGGDCIPLLTRTPYCIQGDLVSSMSSTVCTHVRRSPHWIIGSYHSHSSLIRVNTLQGRFKTAAQLFLYPFAKPDMSVLDPPVMLQWRKAVDLCCVLSSGEDLGAHARLSSCVVHRMEHGQCVMLLPHHPPKYVILWCSHSWSLRTQGGPSGFVWGVILPPHVADLHVCHKFTHLGIFCKLPAASVSSIRHLGKYYSVWQCTLAETMGLWFQYSLNQKGKLTTARCHLMSWDINDQPSLSHRHPLLSQMWWGSTVATPAPKLAFHHGLELPWYVRMYVAWCASCGVYLLRMSFLACHRKWLFTLLCLLHKYVGIAYTLPPATHSGRLLQ